MPLHVTHLMNAFLLAVVLLLLLEKAAWSVGLIDRPSGHKVHEGGVPVIGGIAMFVAFALTVFLVDGLTAAPWPLIGGLAILVVLGVIDDRHGLRAPLRLAVQIVAAVVIVVPGSHLIADLGDVIGSGAITSGTMASGALAGEVGAAKSAAATLLAAGGAGLLELGPFAMPFTLVFVIGLINAFNMMDGLDGLAGGVAASAFFWLAVAAGLTDGNGAVLPLLLLCVTLGFLVFNLRHPWQARARVFMGDAGSTMLGAGVAFFIVAAATGPTRLAPLPAWLWLCALPAIDTLSLIVRRLMVGQSPMASDRRHLHHILLQAGLSPCAVTAAIVMASFVLGGLGVAGARLGVPDNVMVLGLVLIVGGHVWFVGHFERRATEHRDGSTPAAVGTVIPARPVRKRLS